MDMCLDHVAILVRSVDRAAQKLRGLGIPIGVKEAFEDVGTEEIYVGDPALNGLLLLQEAAGPGPYRRALEKRGAGLHHIAISTTDFEAFNDRLSSLGWYVHPSSLKKYGKGDTVFYVKPGVDAIIESLPRKEPMRSASFVEEVMVRVDRGKEACIEGIGIGELRCSNSDVPRIVIRGTRLMIDELV